MFGKFADPDINLTAPAHCPATTNRVNINTKLTAAAEPMCHVAPGLTPRWGEDYFHIAVGWSGFDADVSGMAIPDL